MKIRAEGNKIEKRKMLENINQTKVGFKKEQLNS